MRLSMALVLCIAACAQAPNWRQSFSGLLNRPSGSVSARDLESLGSQIALAGQYCVGLAPGDYEANRELVRQMTAYLATVQVAAGDRQMNLSLRRLTKSLGAFPCAYALPPRQDAPVPAPPAAPSEAPFAKTAPARRDIAEADRDRAQDLSQRYEMDASHAASAWKNAEVVRLSLVSKGMSLNAQTAASVDRLKLFLDEAADALRAHKWDDALSSLQSAEYETQRVTKAVGN